MVALVELTSMSILEGRPRGVAPTGNDLGNFYRGVTASKEDTSSVTALPAKTALSDGDSAVGLLIASEGALTDASDIPGSE